MSLLDSKSEFDSRAQQVGLVEEVVQARRLLFTAHILIIASLKEEVARASSAADVVRKLPPVERKARLTKLREKLPGIDLTRHQEPSYELVDAFSAMLEARSVR